MNKVTIYWKTSVSLPPHFSSIFYAIFSYEVWSIFFRNHQTFATMLEEKWKRTIPLIFEHLDKLYYSNSFNTASIFLAYFENLIYTRKSFNVLA